MASVTVGEVGEVSGAGGGYASFDGGVGFFAGLDAVNEVLHVGEGAVAEAVFGEDGVFFARDGFVVEGHGGAVDFEGSFGAAEFEAAVVDGGGHHAFVDDVEAFSFLAGIAEGGLNGVWAVPFGEVVFVGEHLRG